MLPFEQGAELIRLPVVLCDQPCRTLSDLSFSLASVYLDPDAATADKMSQLAAAVMMDQRWAQAGNQRLHNVTGLTNNLQVRHWPKQVTHSSCLSVFNILPRRPMQLLASLGIGQGCLDSTACTVPTTINPVGTHVAWDTCVLQ